METSTLALRVNLHTQITRIGKLFVFAFGIYTKNL